MGSERHGVQGSTPVSEGCDQYHPLPLPYSLRACSTKRDGRAGIYRLPVTECHTLKGGRGVRRPKTTFARNVQWARFRRDRWPGCNLRSATKNGLADCGLEGKSGRGVEWSGIHGIWVADASNYFFIRFHFNVGFWVSVHFYRWLSCFRIVVKGEYYCTGICLGLSVFLSFYN